MRLRAIIVACVLTFGLFWSPGSSGAWTHEEIRVEGATSVMKEIMEIPESGIPPSLLDSAYAIAIFPDLLKAGFILGARYGGGLIVVRSEDKSWSNPVFYTMTGGSFGFQIGAQASDIILVFKTARSLDWITGGNSPSDWMPRWRQVRSAGTPKQGRTCSCGPKYCPTPGAGDSSPVSRWKGRQSRSTTAPMHLFTTCPGFSPWKFSETGIYRSPLSP